MFFFCMQFAFCLYISVETLVKSWIFAGFGQACQGMSNFSKKRKQQYVRKGLSYFVYLLHVVWHPWKLESYYVIIVGYWPACSKFSETSNQQNLWEGSVDFVEFLQLVIWILLDINWSHKNMTFSNGIVRDKFTFNQIVKFFKLKNLTNDMRYQDHLFLSMKLEEMLR